MFPRRTAASTLVFLDPVIEEMPFPVQRVQTDRGREFFAMAAQQWLMDHCIKFRPNRPASPHLNGKVERSQKTNREEFWAVTCLLYTSDAADERSSVDLGGRRLIKTKNLCASL